MGKILLIIIVFLVIGGFMIKNSLDTDFDDKEDTKDFFKKFTGWVSQVGKSTKDTAKYAIDQDWLPKNESNVTIEVD